MEFPIPASPFLLTVLLMLTSLKTLTSLPVFTFLSVFMPSPAFIQYPESSNKFVQNYITYVNRAIIIKKAARLGSLHV